MPATACSSRYRARVLARPHDYARTLGRERLEQLAGVLVAAVLRPHQAEHRELDLVRLALHERDDPLVLGVGQAKLAMPRLHAATSAADSNSRRPSDEP